MQHVGYRLIEQKSGKIVQEWGGLWEWAPGVPNPINLPNGDTIFSPALDTDYNGYTLVAWEMDERERPKRTKFDGADFLSRVTDDEYAAITKSENIQVQRWLDTFRLRGEIDVAGKTAQAAKEGLIALGLLTKERAEEIFKPE